MVDLRGKDFLKLLDFTEEEIRHLLNIAKELKQKKKEGIPHKYLEGKQIALIFEKDSTRTRCSFEVAAHDLGMEVTYLGPTGSQIGKKESIADTARVLSTIYDGIEYRGYGQEIVEELAKYAKVPVWNGLTTEFHPTQMLADVLTIEEEFGSVEGRKIVFCGDARNNVASSLMVVSAKLGMHYTCCSPKELFPKKDLVKKSQTICKKTNGSITLTEDILEGAKDADVIYTDVWVSMGEDPTIWEKRIELLKPYQVTKEVMTKAKKGAIFLHCLPSFHNLETKMGKEIYEKYKMKEMEVTDEVFESSSSRVFEEAENRMHTIKAVILETLK